MANELKKRQKQIYDFIVSFALKHNYLPTIREIGAGTKLKSTASVVAHMTVLQQKGYITRKPGQAGYSVKGLKYSFTEDEE